MMLTLVITAYNAEKTIFKLLSSISQQLVEGIEVIVIDDGSIDKTYSICKSIENKKIKIIHEENAGVSFARNVGIKYASSDYLWFIDSDDFLPDNVLLKIINVLKQKSPDVIMANYYKEKDGNIIPKKIFSAPYEEFNGKKEVETCVKQILLKNMFEFAVWKNIYKRSFLIKNELFFDTNLFMNEDGNWFNEVITKCHSIISINEYVYIYSEDNNDSITKEKQNLASYKCSNYVYTRWFYLFDKLINDIELKKMLKTRMANGYASSSSAIFSFDKSEKKAAIKLFENNAEVLEFSNNAYGKILKKGSIFGFKSFLYITNLINMCMRRIKK